MSRKVSFYKNYPEFVDIGELYDVSVKSMEMFYSPSNPQFDTRFKFYSPEEIEKEKEGQLEDIDASLAFTLLASIEASFRVDYLQRCYRKKKDPLSRIFRNLHNRKGNRVSLKDDLLDAWKEHSSVRPLLLGDIKDAFNYRHWLAHGRYWDPKFGRRYDFSNIYDLANEVDRSFPFERP